MSQFPSTFSRVRGALQRLLADCGVFEVTLFGRGKRLIKTGHVLYGDGYDDAKILRMLVEDVMHYADSTGDDFDGIVADARKEADKAAAFEGRSVSGLRAARQIGGNTRQARA